jgi:DNA-binding CsgD family transcriptional regulator
MADSTLYPTQRIGRPARMFRRSSRRLRAAADYLDGFPTKQIAESHHIDPGELYRIVAALNIQPREASHAVKITTERRDFIASHYASGMLLKNIAGALRISERTVRKVVTSLDLPRRHPAAFGRMRDGVRLAGEVEAEA